MALVFMSTVETTRLRSVARTLSDIYHIPPRAQTNIIRSALADHSPDGRTLGGRCSCGHQSGRLPLRRAECPRSAKVVIAIRRTKTRKLWLCHIKSSPAQSMSCSSLCSSIAGTLGMRKWPGYADDSRWDAVPDAHSG